MKKILFLAALALAFSGAQAQQSASADQTATSNSSSVAGSTASNNGNDQSITFTSPEKTTANVNYSGTQTLKNVPSVAGPNLTTSNDTCMGSTSGSINGPGFGVGLGTTWTDDNCVMLKNSRELWNMGMKAASMALMCTEARTRNALEVTGFKCPNHIDGSARPVGGTQPVASAAGEKYTDPIVRARLGLPPLAAAK